MAVSGLRSCSSRTRTSRNGPLTRRRGMTCRGMLHLPALLGTLAAALLMACAVALLAVSGEAEATFNVEKFEPRGGQVYDGVDANQQAGDTVAVSTQRWADYSNNVLGGEEPLISRQTGSKTSPKTIARAGLASSGNRSDYVILKVASALRTYSKPTFLRIDQEMNAYWFAWCAYNSDGTPRANTTEDFKDMWRRMHIIFEGGTVS